MIAGIIYILIGILLIYFKNLTFYIKFIIKSFIIIGTILIGFEIIGIIYHIKVNLFQILVILIMMFLNNLKLKKYEIAINIEQKMKKII